MLSFAEQNGSGKQQRRNRLEELLNELIIADIDSAARPLLARFAQLDAASIGGGKVIGKNDLWIAASAAVSDALLITTDRDFDHLSPSHLSLWRIDPEAKSWPSTPAYGPDADSKGWANSRALSRLLVQSVWHLMLDAGTSFWDGSGPGDKGGLTRYPIVNGWGIDRPIRRFGIRIGANN